MYTIKRAAEIVGVSESTLRGWERRNGLDVATRTKSGYRLYDNEAVAVLRRMHQLLGEGWSADAAAREAVTGTPPPLDLREATHELVRIAHDLDEAALTSLLDRQFATASFETMIDTWLFPAMGEIGRAWTQGEVTIPGEHLVTHAVLRRLSAAYDQAGDNPQAPRVVLGLPSQTLHDLGLLAFATCLRRVGLATTFLGADIPEDAWTSAIAIDSVASVVLSVPRAEDAEKVAETVALIHHYRPDVVIAIGGSGQDLVTEHCVHLGHQFGRAASELKRALA